MRVCQGHRLLLGSGAAVLYSDTPVTLRLAASPIQVDFHLLLPGATSPSHGFRNRMGLPCLRTHNLSFARSPLCVRLGTSHLTQPRVADVQNGVLVSSPQIKTQLWMTPTCSVLSVGDLHVESTCDPRAEAHTVPIALGRVSEGSRWPAGWGGCTLEPRGLPPGPSWCPAQPHPLDACVNLPSSVSGLCFQIYRSG